MTRVHGEYIGAESDDVMLMELVNLIIQPLAPPTININPISNEDYNNNIIVVCFLSQKLIIQKQYNNIYRHNHKTYSERRFTCSDQHKLQ